jgi:uncharacterized protein (TIGR02246 family)
MRLRAGINDKAVWEIAMRRFALLTAAIFALSANPGFAQDAEQAIEEASVAWEAAFNSGSGKGVADLYTEDGALFPPGAARVDGKAAIAAFWQAAIDSGLKDADLQTTEVAGFGDLAYETGGATLSATGTDGNMVPVALKYIVVWQRGGDGT